MTNLHLTSLAADSGVTAGSDVKKLADFAIAGGQAAMHLNRNTVTGATAPLQMTDGAAGVNGTAVSWYTKPLQAVTIAGAITATIWTRENATANNVAPTIRIERCSANGTPLATIVSETTNHGAGEMATTAGGASDSISVTAANVVDTAIASGERLRITLWIDDAADQGGTGSMASGGQGEAWVNGPVGSQGQAQIAFTESVVPIAELTAAYNFDEASGNALDASGNGRNFAISGNMARTSSSGGHTNAGLATTTTASEPGPTLFGQTGGRTLMMWVKITSDFTGWIFEWHDNTLDTGFWGLLRLSGNMGFRGRNAAGTISHANVAHSVDGAWHHWAGTYDGVNVRTYLDGSLVATVALANGIDTVQPDLIRMFTTAAAVTVDDVRVYDGILTAAEITSLKDTPVASAGASGSLIATLSSVTSSMSGSATATGTLAGTASAVTASFAGSNRTSGAMSGTVSAVTATAAGNSVASGPIAGTISGIAATGVGSAVDSGSLAGTVTGISAAFAASSVVSGSMGGTLSQVTSAMVAQARANGTLVGSLSAQTASFSGDVQVMGASGTLNGTLSGVQASVAAEAVVSGAVAGQIQGLAASMVAAATASGALAGQLGSVTVVLSGQVTGLPRDIVAVVTVDLGETAVITESSLERAIVTEGTYDNCSITESTTERAAVADGTYANYAITEGDMRKQWRVGTEEYIDFSVNVKDADGSGLTQSEVEGYGWTIAVVAGATTPAVASFGAPSVTPVVTSKPDGSFDVAIKHMYAAATAGLKTVFVRFGPTPESPILEATSFTVL